MSGRRGRARRFLTVPLVGLTWASWVALTPLWLPLAAGIDVFRRRGATALRIAAVIGTYLTIEVVGLVAVAGLSLGRALGAIDAARWLDLHFRLEAWWGSTLFAAVRKIFRLRLEVEGDADLGRGPYLLAVRHASSGDTLLASALVSRPHGIRLRYVLKKELLWDPCLDIVGRRLPNVFVERGGESSTKQIDAVRKLAVGLGARDAVLIYPEGTRFSDAKRRRLLERFHARGDTKLLEYTRSLRSVLPPRPGGILGLLEAAPSADVIVCAHTGFEGAATLASVWNGELAGRTIRVRFVRILRHQIPEAAAERAVWLLEEWRRVDEWVELHA